jgi:hypothetical protein
MKGYLYILTLLSIMPRHNGCMAQVVDSAKIVNSLSTSWRSISHEYSSIYGLEEEEIKRYSKQRLSFTRDSINMYSDVLYDPKYVIKKVSSESYAKDNFDCTKQRLGIVADSVFEITISSVTKPAKNGTTHKMTDVIAFDEDCIYVVVDGVIFKLIDANRKIERSNTH